MPDPRLPGSEEFARRLALLIRPLLIWEEGVHEVCVCMSEEARRPER